MDLQFPHHENEIAQSEGATGETFVNVLDAQWLRARGKRERCPSRWVIFLQCGKF